MRFLKRNAIALIALVFAMTGTGIAASRYLITSTSQIKPSVLRELRGGGAAASAAVPKGPKAIIDRVGLVAPTTTVSEPAEGPFERPSVALTSGSWTQAAHQADAIIGEVTVAKPPEGACEGRAATIEVLFDGRSIGFAFARTSDPYEAETTYQLAWEAPVQSFQRESGATWLPDSDVARSQTLTMRAGDDCDDGSHYRIDSVNIDVLGFR